MEKYRAIPQGYMMVGEIAKKMGVPVSTLHYYDKEGILSPSSESEGGRRLYSYKDIIRLHQIQSMKYLGFSLDDIKIRLPSIDTPEEVSKILTEQAKGISEKIKSLKDVQESIEKLNAEVLQMDIVDWAKYAGILIALQAKNDAYWAIRHFSNDIFNHIHRQFDKKSQENMLHRLQQLMQRAATVQNNGHNPESELGLSLAKDWWEFVMDFTGGDMSLLPELSAIGYSLSNSAWKDIHSFDRNFIEKALGNYLESIGYDKNPFD